MDLDLPTKDPLTKLILLEVILDLCNIVQVYTPGIPSRGLHLAVLIAVNTVRTSDSDRLPAKMRKSDLARKLGLTQAGMNRLLESLTPDGRKDRSGGSDDAGGYGLIETDDWLSGRGAETFVLTPKGRDCIERMIEALETITGPATGYFGFHDLDSLFARLVDERAKRKKR